MNRIEITKTGIDFQSRQIDKKNWAYISREVKNVWPYLREPCTIANGVTWEDLLNIILENDSLKYLVETCYPHYLFISPINVISRNVIIKNHNMEIKPVLSPYEINKPLILKDEIKVKNNDRTPLPASMRWSLLEILDILFSDAKSQLSCFLYADGLYDESHSPIKFDPITCLMSNCEISEWTTLGDVFRFVSKNKTLETFISEYSSCDVSKFHDAAKIKPDTLSTDIDYLQIGSYGELFSKKFYIGSKFYGVSNNAATRTEISVTTTPMKELAHLHIMANNQFMIRFAENSKIFAGCYRNFTLLDILHAIYWDIGLLSERSSRKY